MSTKVKIGSFFILLLLLLVNILVFIGEGIGSQFNHANPKADLAKDSSIVLLSDASIGIVKIAETTTSATTESKESEKPTKELVAIQDSTESKISIDTIQVTGKEGDTTTKSVLSNFPIHGNEKIGRKHYTKKIDSSVTKHPRINTKPTVNTKQGKTVTSSPPVPKTVIPAITSAKDLENRFDALGLSSLHDVDPSIKVKLKYGTEDNFFKKDFYKGCQTCYLQEEVAKKLAKAQEFLREVHPTYSLLVLDCARPKIVQEEMWEQVKEDDKKYYVEAPNLFGAMNNYGAAVDLTIVNAKGQALNMGTKFGDFSKLSQPRYNKTYAANGQLTPKLLQNRILLREVMRKAKFIPNSKKWWHFDAFDTKKTRERYMIIE